MTVIKLVSPSPVVVQMDLEDGQETLKYFHPVPFVSGLQKKKRKDATEFLPQFVRIPAE